MNTKTKPPLILIVDDEEAIVTGLKYRLKQAGYRVIGTYTGTEALQTARTAEPDLILLDQCLPELIGSDVVTELNRDPATCNIPVVMLSGAEVKQHDAITSGASAFLRKPYRKDELLDLVESLVALPESTQGNERWRTAKLY